MKPCNRLKHFMLFGLLGTITCSKVEIRYRLCINFNLFIIDSIESLVNFKWY